MAPVHFGIDFMAAPRRTGRAGRVVLAVGVAALLGSAWLLSASWEGQREQVERLARLEAAQQRAAAVVPVRAASPTEQRLRVELDRIAAALHAPWFDLLEVLEASARPSVHVLQLSVEGGFSRAQLQVEAAQLDDVLQYLRGLSEAGWPIREAKLVNHERLGGEADTGGRPRVQARIGLQLQTTPAAAVARTGPAPTPAGLRVACAAGDRSSMAPCASERRP